MKTKAFIAGATGYTGQALVQQLAARGLDVRAHVRPDSTRLAHWQAHFASTGARVDTTPWEPQAMRKALADFQPNLVFCLIGTTRRRMKAAASRDESYMSVDYGLTRLLAEAARPEGAAPGQGPVFVYLSAIGAEKAGPGAYYKARHLAEEAVRESGLRYVLVRPGVITGEGREERRLGESLAGVLGDASCRVAELVGARHFARRYRSIDAQALARNMADRGLEALLPGAQSSRVVENEELVRMP